MTNKIDQDLLENGDSRNVIDKYKNWKLEEIAKDLKKSSSPLHIAIENYQHDYNIGTIVRNANAFNVSGVHIIGKRHWNRRGAMSTEKYLTLFNHKNVDEFIKWCAQNDLPIIGIDNIPGSVKLHSSKIPKECVVVFGQEGPGLSTDMQNACKEIVAIEQFGSTRSVNVGVASGIILYRYASDYLM
jgi:tRNA G18 (ribose-2'-O)-methylase SpoU